MEQLVLEIVTPGGAQPFVSCDSVHLSVCDDLQGQGGGRYGIRPGHVESLLCLAAGKVDAFLESKLVFSARCGDGFATVSNNKVTLVVETCQTE